MMRAGQNFYQELRRKGCTDSLRNYSRRYLGRAENCACLRGVQPSARWKAED